MASEENTHITEDQFILDKSQLNDLKNRLISQLANLIEENETFNSEIMELNKAIKQSNDERILLIQSLKKSSNTTTEEQRPTTHSIPLLPNDDEPSLQMIDEMSPSYKKFNTQLSRDEDYIEKRGRKPKSLRVSIPTSGLLLPSGAKQNMIKTRGKYKKTIKKQILNSNNTDPLPWMFTSTDSNSNNPPAQITCFPPINLAKPPNTDSTENNIPNSSNLLFVLNSSDPKVSTGIYPVYNMEREFKDGLAISENQSPNSTINRNFSFSMKIEEETEKSKEPTI